MNLKNKDVRLKPDPGEADEKIPINFKEINSTRHLLSTLC